MPVLAAPAVTTVQRTVTATVTDPETGESTTVSGTYVVQVAGGT